MKIGILTLPLHTNYGGLLQAYALQTVLEQQGHEVCILDTNKQPNIRPWYIRPVIWTYHAYQRYIKHQNVTVFAEGGLKRAYQEYLISSQNTRRFINHHLHTREYRQLSEIRHEEFDAIIVGSDQVWRICYFFGQNIKNAYLSFTEGWNIKRISYAASFGTDDWEYSEQQTMQCKNCIQKFDAVSVREKSGLQLCKEHFGIDAIHVLDPTMLLCREDYLQLINHAEETKHNGELLLYLLDETEMKEKIVSKIASSKGFMPFRVNSRIEDPYVKLEDRIQPSVEGWIQGFRDAKFVVTDSFHACVFSILFHKPFIVIGNQNRGLGRFYSLLEMFGLEKHLVMSLNKLNVDSDYEIPHSVYEILNTWRVQSLKFLLSNLNK